MFMLDSMLFQLGQLLKIVGWISLPLIVITVLLTIVLHYRRRRRAVPDVLLPDAPPLVFPMTARSGNTGALSVMPDHQVAGTWLQYGRQLNEARLQNDELRQRYASLKQDYDQLLSGKLENAGERSEALWSDMQQTIRQYELKLAQLQQALDYANSNGQQETGENRESLEMLKTWKEKYEHLSRELNLKQDMLDAQLRETQRMEQQLREVQASWQQDRSTLQQDGNSRQNAWDEMERQHADERQRLEDQVRDLKEALAAMQGEHQALQEQWLDHQGKQLQNADHIEWNDLREKLDWMEEDRNRLKQELANGQAWQDIINEKDQQILFIQQQLENRIRLFHELQVQDQESQAKLAKYASDQEEWLRESRQVKTELQALSGENGRLQESLDNLYHQLEKMGQQMESDKRQRAEMARLIEERDYLLGREQEGSESLRQNLQREQERASLLEKKLMHNIDLLKQMYEAVIGGTARQEVEPDGMLKA